MQRVQGLAAKIRSLWADTKDEFTAISKDASGNYFSNKFQSIREATGRIAVHYAPQQPFELKKAVEKRMRELVSEGFDANGVYVDHSSIEHVAPGTAQVYIQPLKAE